MDLCVCVSEEDKNGEGVGLQELSQPSMHVDTLEPMSGPMDLFFNELFFVYYNGENER